MVNTQLQDLDGATHRSVCSINVSCGIKCARQTKLWTFCVDLGGRRIIKKLCSELYLQAVFALPIARPVCRAVMVRRATPSWLHALSQAPACGELPSNLLLPVGRNGFKPRLGMVCSAYIRQALPTDSPLQLATGISYANMRLAWTMFVGGRKARSPCRTKQTRSHASPFVHLLLCTALYTDIQHSDNPNCSVAMFCFLRKLRLSGHASA